MSSSNHSFEYQEAICSKLQRHNMLGAYEHWLYQAWERLADDGSLLIKAQKCICSKSAEKSSAPSQLIITNDSEDIMAK